jgi:hypothetical protein
MSTFVDINSGDTLEVAYRISDTADVGNILDINVTEQPNGENIDNTNIINELKNVEKFHWTPKDKHIGGKYSFTINNDELIVHVRNVPDSGILRYNFHNENNDTSIVKDIWGDYDAPAYQYDYKPNGGHNNRGSYSFSSNTNSHIASPFGRILNESYTIITWLKWNSVPGSNNQDIWRHIDTDWQPGIWVNNSTMRNHASINTSGDGTYSDSDSSKIINTNWNFIGGSYNSETDNISNIINGEKQTIKNTGSFSRNTNKGPLYIGGAGYDRVGMEISEFRIYDKVLSTNELSNLYSTGSIYL